MDLLKHHNVVLDNIKLEKALKDATITLLGEYKITLWKRERIIKISYKGNFPESIVERKKSPYPKTHNYIYERSVKNFR